LNLANVLKLNDDEIVIIAGLSGWEKSEEKDICLQLLKNYNLDIVILTKGAEGSFVCSRQERSYRATPQVQVADTVGAGDAFTAAFIASYLHGDGIVRAHQLAVEVSAYVCTQRGAMPVLPEKYVKRINN
jgi:fructokinase